MNPLKPLVSAAAEASQDLKRGWIIMPLSLGLYLAVIAVAMLVSPLGGMVAGLIVGIASLVALVQFYTWCWQLNKGESFKVKDVTSGSGFWGLGDHIFSNIAFVGFIMWITFALINPAGNASQIVIFLKLGVAFIFNPIAEVAILGLAAQGALFTESFRITKDHLVVWFLPLLILIALGVLIGGVVPPISAVVMSFALNFDVMFPAGYFVSLTRAMIDHHLISILLAAPLACWFTLFRLSLLERLEQ